MKNITVGIAITILLNFTIITNLKGQKTEVNINHVNGPIYFLQIAGGNMLASVGDDGVLLVDTDFKDNAPLIEKEIQSVSDQEIKYVINTHYHDDHVKGNEYFCKSASIISHYNTKKFHAEKLKSYENFQYLSDSALPRITFHDSLSIFFNDEEIKLCYMPYGHSNSDIVVWFTKSKVVHLGDIFRNGALPYIDIAAKGSVQGLYDNLSKLYDLIPDDYVIIPGHGKIATKNDFKIYINYYKSAIKFVKDNIDIGKSLGEIKENGLPEMFDSYLISGLTEKEWIEIVYNSFMIK